MSARVIGQFQKNSSEIIKVQLQEWKGEPYVDIRVWVAGEDGAPGAQPTKKGITLSAELLPELKAAIEKTIEIIERGIDGQD